MSDLDDEPKADCTDPRWLRRLADANSRWIDYPAVSATGGGHPECSGRREPAVGPRDPSGCSSANSDHKLSPDLLLEMTDAERKALPPKHHRPAWDGLGVPHSWICAVCWGDGWQTSWPCEVAQAHGRDVAIAAGLEYVS